ncbi:putative ABC transporter ATP-binding protein [Candidatus Norongarragalina meridionalis]|nr:putative ABC transporter ATP-binding protein [Candidatus Norongarragalina meridionalis]
MLECEGLSVTYADGRRALRGITLRIPSGSFLGLCGANGSGKSTLALALSGVIPQAIDAQVGGAVLLDGKPLPPLNELARSVGVLFQDAEAQIVSVTAEEEAAFVTDNLGMPKRNAVRAMRMMGVLPLRDRLTNELSGGEIQRLLLSSILAAEPPILILDEPSAFLDSRGVRDLYGALARLKKRGKTVVCAEQNTKLLEELADDVVFLKNGRIATEGKRILSNHSMLHSLGVISPNEL